MTIIGGADIADGTRFQAELVVIGAGPAGIVSALEAARRGVDVVVIETGNRKQTSVYQKLSSANIANPKLHAPLELAVSRQIGGTSSMWGGRCVPYDPIDFLPRNSTYESTWPVKYEDTQRYFARACEWFKCGRPVFNVEELAHLPSRMVPGLVGGEVLDSALERWSLPTNFGEVYYEELDGTVNLRVIADATCVRLNLDDDRERVTDIVCKTLYGNSFTVSADTFIVAAGGLEGTRLLMCSPGRDGKSIGDHSGHLGHWYMAHLEGVVSDLVLSTPAKDTVHSYERDVDGSYVRRRLTFSTDFLLENDLPNIAGWIANPELADASHKNAQLSLAYLVLISPLGRLVAPPAQRLSLTGVKIPGAPYGMVQQSSVWAHLRNLLRHPLDAVRFVYEFGAKRVLSRGRKPPGFFVANAANRYPLQYHAEHLPNYESSVRLSSDVDELGVPKLEIDISFSDEDIKGVLKAHEHWDQYLRATGLGRIEYHSNDLTAAVRARTGGGFHQVGTTRMAKDPMHGVVDENLKVHGVGNLHVASSSVFVTSGQANSTFMVVVFAIRLIDTLYDAVRSAATPASEAPAVREIGRGELRAPARIIDIDIARPVDEVVDVERFASIWCLVRRDGEAIATRFYDVSRVSSIAMSDLCGRATRLEAPPPIESSRAVDGSLTVVICTRDRSAGLLRALESLSQQSDSAFDVLIVDNSRDGDVAKTWDGFDGLDTRCCHEAEPGLSRARNRALSELRSEHVAWIDDDEVADRDWISWIKRGFAEPDRPDAVAGVMLPAELETEAQVNFERYGGFNKGRGMEPDRLRAGTPSVMDPLYPLPGFGAGGNMAFRTDALRAIGGFDNRLGAGTLTRGGEETKALSQLLDNGSLVLHWPPAVTWHYHRRTDDQLVEQFFGYSAGLTAFYMSVLISSPSSIFRVLGFVPRGLKRLQSNRVGETQPEGPPAGFPEHLLRAGRRGLYQGAWLYVREFARQYRFKRGSAVMP